MIATLRSLPDPAALGAEVAAAYQIDVTGCTLLRTLVNDVYRIDTPTGPYALKLYGPGRQARAAVEVGLAAHVAARGVDIARGVPLADGRAAGDVLMAEGLRAYTMWQWAPGTHAPQPFGEGLYRRFGIAVAGFHAAADDFAGAPTAVGTAELLDDVLARVTDADDRALIAALAAAAGRYLGEAGPRLERGACHGDVTLDNAHLDGDRFILFDLDLACDTWRAQDLVGVASTPSWAAFLAGYRSVRAFGAADIAALPWLGVAQSIDYLHFHLVGKPTYRGIDSLREGWADQNFDDLRTAGRALLP
jgi:Ser/Thr protein kinase RdoA (MazF antagonist)